MYWIQFNNIHTFTYQENDFIRFCCLFLKSSKAFTLLLSININSPIRKLLASINQCYDLLLFTIWFTISSLELRTQICTKIEETTFTKSSKGIDINDIGNLENLLRVVFIDEERGNLKVVVGSLLEILTKRRSQKFSRPLDLNSFINAVGKGISSICKCYIVNQLGEHDFSCG